MLMQPHRLSGKTRRQRQLRQGGMSLIELMIAMAVLSIGMLGSVGMILAAIQSNARNKNDSTAVVLDQQILEMFATLNNYPKTGTVLIEDCAVLGAGSTHQASLVEGAFPGGNGATLYTPATAPLPAQVGDINWTAAAPAFATAGAPGYAMNYRTCNGDTFEVRWNVMQVNAVGAPPSSRISLLTVSSRQTSANGSDSGMLFSQPTTLKTLIEN